MPNVHQAIGNLKAWLIGTHKGVTRRHLAACLDEFVFRFNRRHNLAAAFQTLLGLGAMREPTTYDTITGAKDIPRIIYTPSRKQTGRRQGRKVPSAGHHSGTSPEATGQVHRGYPCRPPRT